MRELYYFAYGSNLHPERLRERVPSSRAVAVAELDGHVLRFHKRGRDDSGKCSILPSNRPRNQVYGMVYRMAAAEQANLDRAEGLGVGYLRVELTVRIDGTPRPVFSYRAQDEHIDDALAPFAWYHQLVLAGARHHGLPAAYIAAIEAIATQPDPDRERHARHARLLSHPLETD